LLDYVGAVCLELTGSRPWEITRWGYYYQSIMILLHTIACLIGLIFSCRLVHPPESIGYFPLFAFIVGCYCSFSLEYLICVFSGRASANRNFRNTKMFLSVPRLLDLILLLLFAFEVLRVYAILQTPAHDSITGVRTLSDRERQGLPMYRRLEVKSPIFGNPNKGNILEQVSEAIFTSRGFCVVLTFNFCRAMELQYFRELLNFMRHNADVDGSLLEACCSIAMFIFLLGGTLWWIFEREVNPEFDSIAAGIYKGSIFLLSEWCVCDFSLLGKILCVVYCALGVATFGIFTGAIYDSLGEVLTNYSKQKSKLDWARTKEWYIMQEKRTRSNSDTISAPHNCVAFANGDRISKTGPTVAESQSSHPAQRGGGNINDKGVGFAGTNSSIMNDKEVYDLMERRLRQRD